MRILTEIDHVVTGSLANDDFLGAAVCLKDGNMLSCHMPEFYESEMVQETVYTLTNAFPTIKELGFKLDETDFTFERMRLVVKELEDIYIVFLVEPDVKTGIVNAAMQVTEKKLDEILRRTSQTEDDQSNEVQVGDGPEDESIRLKEELEENSVLIFGEETTFGQSLQKKLNDEDVLFFNNRSNDEN